MGALVPSSAAVFLLVSVRIGLVLALLPGFNGRSVPNQAKIALTVALTLILTPFVPVEAQGLTTPVGFVIALGRETLVGLAMGLGVAFVFTAVETAAAIVSLQMGLNLSALFQPTLNTQGSMLTSLYLALAALVFFTTNSHHLLILALQRSFVAVPVGTGRVTAASANSVITLSGTMLADAVRIGLPIAATLLLVDLALGLLNRMAPQIGVFFVGLPAKLFIGFLVFGLTLPFLLRVLQTLVSSGLEQHVLQVLEGLR